MVDRHTAAYLSPFKNPGDARSYAEIQFHNRVGLKDVQSIDLIRTDPQSRHADVAQMVRMGFDKEAFGLMSNDEQATYLERFARGQQDQAAKIRASLAEKGFPDIEVRTGFLNRELIEEGDFYSIPKYSEKVVYDTADELAENQIGLLDSLRGSHLQGSIASSKDTMQGAQAVVEEMSPFMKQILAENAAKGARVGVQSMETASKVMEGMGQALKVMRSIR
jgi:hypothetical protein